MVTMTPAQFVKKWSEIELKERNLRKEISAMGWPHNLSEEGILERLLGLNLERAGK